MRSNNYRIWSSKAQSLHLSRLQRLQTFQIPTIVGGTPTIPRDDWSKGSYLQRVIQQFIVAAQVFQVHLIGYLKRKEQYCAVLVLITNSNRLFQSSSQIQFGICTGTQCTPAL